LKRSKCYFGACSVSYLGHIISVEGVAIDYYAKVQVVLTWLVPSTIYVVRALLGLAGYYKSFIHDYGAIVAPLTRLLKKEGFRWTLEAEEACLSCAAVCAYIGTGPTAADV
jgi:hypothetical protein